MAGKAQQKRKDDTEGTCRGGGGVAAPFRCTTEAYTFFAQTKAQGHGEKTAISIRYSTGSGRRAIDNRHGHAKPGTTEPLHLCNTVTLLWASYKLASVTAPNLRGLVLVFHALYASCARRACCSCTAFRSTSDCFCSDSRSFMTQRLAACHSSTACRIASLSCSFFAVTSTCHAARYLGVTGPAYATTEYHKDTG